MIKTMKNPQFLPSYIGSSLKAWYRSDKNITKDIDGYVSQWDDLSGNDNHLVQATAQYQPSYIDSTLNGQPVIRFNGIDATTGNSLAVTFTLNQPSHIFIVSKWNDDTVRYNWLFDGGANSVMALYGAGTARTTNFYAGTQLIGPSWIGDPYQIFDVVSNTTSKIGINGGIQTTGDAGTSNGGGLTLGAAGGVTPSFFASADIVEVLVFNDELAYVDRYKVIQYLKRRYIIS